MSVFVKAPQGSSPNPPCLQVVLNSLLPVEYSDFSMDQGELGVFFGVGAALGREGNGAEITILPFAFPSHPQSVKSQ